MPSRDRGGRGRGGVRPSLWTGVRPYPRGVGGESSSGEGPVRGSTEGVPFVSVLGLLSSSPPLLPDVSLSSTLTPQGAPRSLVFLSGNEVRTEVSVSQGGVHRLFQVRYPNPDTGVTASSRETT